MLFASRRNSRFGFSLYFFTNLYNREHKHIYERRVEWESPANTVSHDFLETPKLKAKVTLRVWMGGRVLSCSLLKLLIINSSTFTEQIVYGGDSK